MRGFSRVAACELKGPGGSALRRGPILLIDPSEKGAMPLYTAMIAEGLQAAGLSPCVLANIHVVEPDMSRSWTLLRRLPAGRWPRRRLPGPLSSLREIVVWAGCALAVIAAALAVRPSVIHFQHPLHLRLDARLIGLLRRLAPVVWTAHDVTPHDPGRDGLARVGRIYRAVDLVLVHSPPAAAEVARLAAVTAEVAPHPVRVLKDPPSRAVARAQLGLDPHARLAVAVGFIRAYKGYSLLADTWDRLGAAAPRLLVLGALVDAGEGEVMARLAAHAGADVRLGYASDADVIAAIAAADVLLLPHARGSDSGALHMARALGVPVISSDTPQLAAVVDGTGSGVVRPRNAEAWAEAVSGPLPPEPPPPPTPAQTGERHLRLYTQAAAAWSSR